MKKTLLNKNDRSSMLLNDETKKKDSIELLKESSASVISCVNPLQKYAPNPLDVNFRNTTNTSSDHEPLKTRGRDRPKSSLTSRKLVNQVDNPDDNSFSSSKYRSISCEDARQALNESLMKVCSMQNMLETRR